jgi:hypothetical protein
MPQVVFAKTSKKKNLYVNFVKRKPNGLRNHAVLKRNETEESKEFVELKDGRINVNPELTATEKLMLKRLLTEYNGIFAFDSTKLGLCNVREHQINLIDENQAPLKQNPYKYNAAKCR